MSDRYYKLGRALILLAAVFIFRPLPAQENGAAAAASHHSLWKVEGKSNVVYLLGSIHLLKPENFPLAPPLETAYSNAQVAVFETDVAKMPDPEVQMKMVTKAQLPAGETLKQHLSPETYLAFSNHATAAELPMTLMENLKPSVAAMLLDVTEMTKLGVDPQHGIDEYFSGKAGKDGKQLIGLETVDFQIDLITSFSKEEEEMMMKETLEETEKTKQMYGDIVKAWQVGDSAGIEKLLNDTLRKTPTLCKRLLTDRSKSWVPKIEELLGGDKNAVVIVGAAHLVGDEGVVELLRKKGYKITQL